MVEASGATGGVLDPIPAKALGWAPSSELQSSGSFVLLSSWRSALDLRDNELSPLPLGEGVVVDGTIRNLSNESTDTISNI